MSKIKYICFPQTEPPPEFAESVAEAFRFHEAEISTVSLAKGFTSNEVLGIVRPELVRLGFDVEAGKQKQDKIARPVFFGENGKPALNYEMDAYHRGWRCGLEVEAGRAWMGNAIYRDLIQALVMVQVDVLALAVPLTYKYQSGGRLVMSWDYENTLSVAQTLFSHTRFRFPYRLLLIGY